MSPQRIRLSRAKGWRKPEGARNVARPGRWGNPYAIGAWVRVYAEEASRRPGDTPFAPTVIKDWDGLQRERRIPDYWVIRQVPDAATAVGWFRDLIGEWQRDDEGAAEAWLAPLVGHDLACWCPLEDADGNRVPCHADVLLELANGGDLR